MASICCFAPLWTLTHRRGLSKRFLAFAVIVALPLASACTGQVPGNGSNDPGEEPVDVPPGPQLPPPAPGPSFSCAEDAVPSSVPLRRLSRRQQENTIRDLVTGALNSAAEGDKVLAAVSPYLKSLPDDNMPSLGHGAEGPSFRRIDQLVLDAHIQSGYDLALHTGRALSEGSRLGMVLGACATDSKPDNDQTCLRTFIRDFGSRALRTALSDEEVTFYLKFARDPGGPVSAANVANVITGLLLAPRFLYHLESGGSAVSGSDKQVNLSPHELAARLSYQFWDTLPDSTLWQTAMDGSLLKPEVYAEQLERLISDSRTKSTMQQFYREWLDLDDVPKLDLNADKKGFRAFAGNNLPSAGLNEAMGNELVDMADHYTWNEPSSVHQLLFTNASFSRSAELSKIYGAPVWDGKSAPPTFAEGERPGLLTRGARLVNSSGATRPIMRGVFVRRAILCDELPAPPPGVLDNLPKLDPALSGRQVVEVITEKNAGCAGCHQSLLNPIGFMLEGYDGLGRKRDKEIVYDDDGKVLATHTIDDAARPQISDDDDSMARGASELVEHIEKSGKMPGCMARHYFRFAMARREDDERDGCMLERLRRSFAGEGLQAGLRSAATDPAFWRRSF